MIFFFFDVFVFEVDFMLKIEDNLCLFTLSWIEIEIETQDNAKERTNLHLFIKCIKMKLRKRKTVILQKVKMNQVVKENKLAFMIKRLLWVQTKITIRIKRSYSLSHPSYSFLNCWKTSKHTPLKSSDF